MVNLFKGTLLLTNCAVCAVNVFCSDSDSTAPLPSGAAAPGTDASAEKVLRINFGGKLSADQKQQVQQAKCFELYYDPAEGGARLQGASRLWSVPDKSCNRWANLEKVIIGKGVDAVGSQAFAGCPNLHDVIITGPVEAIGERAFAGCPRLATLTLNQGLQKIGEGAFQRTALTTVIIPDSVQEIGPEAFAQCPVDTVTVKGPATIIHEAAFAKCKNLQHLILNCKSIGKGAFRKCKALTNVVIPDSVQEIGPSAFAGCINLATLALNQGLKGIGEWAFRRTALTAVIIPNSVRNVGAGAFAQCPNLDTVIVEGPATIIHEAAFAECPKMQHLTLNCKSIGKNAFRRCEVLVAVAISDSVQVIGESAFAGCSSLATLTLNQGLQVIEKGAFQGTALTAVTIPASVREIGPDAFAQCSNLNTIIIEGPATIIHDAAFAMCPKLKNLTLNGKSIGKNAFRRCKDLTAVTIPASVQVIGESAFAECPKLATLALNQGLQKIEEEAFQGTDLTAVTIPASVQVIGESAFAECPKLATLTLNPGLQIIGAEAFRGTALTDVTIPASVQKIGFQAFAGCAQLESIEFEGETLPEIEPGAFGGTPALTTLDLLKRRMSQRYYSQSGTDEGIQNFLTELFYRDSANPETDEWNGPANDCVVILPPNYDTPGLPNFWQARRDIAMGGNTWYKIDPGGVRAPAPEVPTFPEDVDSIQDGKFSRSFKYIDLSRYTELEIPAGGEAAFLDRIFKSGPEPILSIVELPPRKSILGLISRGRWHCPTGNWKRWDPSVDSVCRIDQPQNLNGVPKVTINFLPKDDELSRMSSPDVKSILFDSRVSAQAQITPAFLASFPNLREFQLPGGGLAPGEDLRNAKNLRVVHVGGFYSADPQSPFVGSSIRQVRFLDGTQTIPGGLFWCCTELKSCNIPDSVTNIGQGAFSNCGITNFNFGINPKFTQILPVTFNDCRELKSIKIPGSVAYIGEEAFRGSGLESVTFAPGSNLTTIGPSAFRDCKLKSIVIPRSVTEIEDNAFAGVEFEHVLFELGSKLQAITGGMFNGCKAKSILIPANVTSVADMAFSGMGLEHVAFEPGSRLPVIAGMFRNCQLKSTLIPESVTRIEDGAFAGTGLTYVAFEPGSRLESIGAGAFASCLLESILIPASVTRIEDWAFSGTVGLTHVAFEPGSRLKSIGANAFANCPSLKSILIPASVTRIDNGAFANTVLTRVAFEPGSHLQTITAGMFDGCQLESIVVPASVTRIDDRAFDGTKLTRIAFEPNSRLESIGADAFTDCQLKSIRLPASVTEINPGAFNNSGLKEAAFEVGSKLQTLHTDAFAGSQLESIEIPAGIETIELGAFGTNIKYITFQDNDIVVPGGLFQRKTRPAGSLFKRVVPPPGTSLPSGCFGYPSLEWIELPAGIPQHELFNTCVGVGKNTVIDCSGCQFRKELDGRELSAFVQAITGTSSITVNQSAFRSMEGCHIVFEDEICQFNYHQFHGWKWTPSSRQQVQQRLNDFNAAKDRLATLREGPALEGGPLPAGNASEKLAVIPPDVQIIGSESGWAKSKIDFVLFSPRAPGRFSSVLPLQIGQKTFEECANLRTVTIPAYVNSIGEQAFYKSGVYSVFFAPNSSLKEIEACAFWECKNLNSITIPNSVSRIDGAAFEASGVYAVHFEAGSRLTEIQPKAFTNCANLNSVTIPPNVTIIGTQAFANSGIRSVVFADGSQLKKIEYYAFSDCRNLKSVIVPSKVHHIGVGAFSHVKSIDFTQNELMQDKLLTEGPAACADLLNRLVRVCPQGCIAKVAQTPGDAGHHFIYYDARWHELTQVSSLADLHGQPCVEILPGVDLKDCNFTGVEVVVLPEDHVFVHELSKESFKGLGERCKCVFIPNSVEQIGANTFAGCKNAKIIIDAENRLQHIGSGAFFGCDLGNLVLHKGVEIDDGVFYGAKWDTIDLCDVLETSGKSDDVKGTLESFCVEAENLTVCPTCHGCKFVINWGDERTSMEAEVNGQDLSFIKSQIESCPQ
ncbi:MAG: leucine-rich repeat domain-containing protein [Holosporales bacterium]|jgi:hypothetical protein|nr:leucine-rich repeat domain-containing protein [Holosporales bacterium]